MKKTLTTLFSILAVALALFAGPVQAGALSDYGENKVVDALLRGQAIGTPATWYVALFTTTCTDAGPGTEVSTSGTAYSRQAVTAALASWAGTQSAGSTVASSGTGGTTSNNVAITWSASTASASRSPEDLRRPASPSRSPLPASRSQAA